MKRTFAIAISLMIVIGLFTGCIDDDKKTGSPSGTLSGTIRSSAGQTTAVNGNSAHATATPDPADVSEAERQLDELEKALDDLDSILESDLTLP